MRKQFVIWLTGFSGAGKTTIAKALEKELQKNNLKTELFDGDEIRNRLEKKYGYTLEERKTFVNNVIYLVKNSIIYSDIDVAIAALISPLKEMREDARHFIEKYTNAKFIEVFVDTPLCVCEERDPKGLYKKARNNELKDFTGIDSPYDRPECPEIFIPPNKPHRGEISLDKSVELIYSFIINQIYDEDSTTH